jgi:hypothetical protein
MTGPATSTISPASKTLTIDRLGQASPGCPRSLEEALARLVLDEYDTIVVYVRSGREDVALVEYLAGTWPHYLRALTVKSVSGDAVDVWDAAAGRFVRERARRSAPAPSRDRQPAAFDASNRSSSVQPAA